jgi:hypothetical protein
MMPHDLAVLDMGSPRFLLPSSATGHKADMLNALANVGFWGKADISDRLADVR